MRLLRLSMTAFGPFAGTEVIRFDALGDNRIFLINGPTGAGKTSILDAICYALYDESTGNERKSAQMRCDSAPLTSLTEVVLDFAIGERRYRIRRVPEQTRAAKSGGGSARQSPEARLWEVEAGVELSESLPDDDRAKLLVDKKVTEATQSIRDITGMTAEQFRQVMVLPQGRFRDLLVASSDDRERIFSELFETSVYKRLEQKLKDAAAAIEDAVSAHAERRRAALAHHAVETAEELDAAIEVARASLASAEVELTAAHRERDAAQRRLHAGRELAQKFADLAAARSAAERLTAKAPAHAERRQRLQRAKAAAALRPARDTWLRLDLERLKAAETLETATTALASANAGLETARAEADGLDALRTEFEQLRKALHELEGLGLRAEALAAAEARRLGREAEFAEARRRVSEQQACVDEQQAAVAKHEARIAALGAQAEPLAAKEIEAVTLEALVATRRRETELQAGLERRQLEYARADEELTHARERADLARRALAALERVWHEGQAAILAEGLAAGTPCPVCGSEEHPRRAHVPDDLPSERDLAAARSAFEAAAKAAVTSERAHALLLGEVANLRQQIADSSRDAADRDEEPLEALQAAFERLSAELPELRAANRDLTLERAALAADQAALADSRELLAELTNAMSEARARCAEAAAEVRAAGQELPESLRGSGALAAACRARRSEMDRLAARIEALEHARKSAEDAKREAALREKLAREGHGPRVIACRNAEDALANLLAGSIFTDRADFESALTGADVAEALEREIRRYDDEILTAETTLANTQRAVEGQAAPELASLEAEAKKTAEVHDARQRVHSDTRSAVENLERTRTRLAESAAEQRALEEKYARIGLLADIANGKNPERVSLQRFVLGALLDDVLREADLRLSAMTRGRFRLQRKLEVTHRGRKAGLDLEVADAYTGTTRAVATLSGGESFMAALSLALGLSAVVQAYSGGIRLDTLFIDEGFGSLDAESLDLALDALFDLQASGRTIGVISHIAMLRERIDARIEIDVGRDGSRTRLALP